MVSGIIPSFEDVNEEQSDPGMPKLLFNLLWKEISSGRECFVYVKNMCKNGDHYWLFANVTPDLNDQGQVTGYYSAR